MNQEFWAALDQLVSETRLVIDRPRGSAHPRYREMIYPLDYGYLEGTNGGDEAGIDVWLGSQGRQVSGVICQVDLLKRDAEIKILLGCSEEEMEMTLRISNESLLSGVLIKRIDKSCEESRED